MALVNCSDGALLMVTNALVPLKDKALPYFPEVVQVAPLMVPLFPLPDTSFTTVPLPSLNPYAATRPSGGVEVGVGVGVGVDVAVGVGVGVGVDVGIAVAVAVAVGVGVNVAVAVAVAVGAGVNVAVAVGVGVKVAVAVGVGVNVAVAVGVGVAVEVVVGRGVGVGVGLFASTVTTKFVPTKQHTTTKNRAIAATRRIRGMQASTPPE